MNDGKESHSRKVQRERTRTALLKAARRAFKDDGFQPTTIRAIAGAAEVATGTVIAHFGSKEELLYAVLHNDINQIAERTLAAVPEDQPIDKTLLFIGESFLKSYAEDAELYGDFLERSLFARGKWGDRFKAQVELVGKYIATVFATAVQRGMIREDIDLKAATLAFLADYYFVLLGQIKSRFTNVEEGIELLRKLIEHHVRGLKQ